MATNGIAYLRNKLQSKRTRVSLRYKYYEMKNAVNDFNLVTPPQFLSLQSTLGWCGKSVDALADRLSFDMFREDNFDLNTIFNLNNADILFDSAILSSLISSCCFIYISADAEPMDKWKASISTLLAFSKDEDGDKPTLGQFAQQSMAPYTEQLRTFAALFAGETGLTLDDLGFVTDNPSSAEAIKASHENLRLTARKAQKTFGSGFLNVGYLAACVRDDFAYKRNQFYLTHCAWAPVFEPDAAMLSGIGDGAIKLNQAAPGYFNETNLLDLTGISTSGG